MKKSAALASTAIGHVTAGAKVRATSIQIVVPAAEFDAILQNFVSSKLGKVKPGLVRSINISLEGDEAAFTVTDQPALPEPETT